MDNINPLKTKINRNLCVGRLSSYRAVNATRLGYKRQPVNAVEDTFDNSTKHRIHAVDGEYDL